jgi:hypothetical protein
VWTAWRPSPPKRPRGENGAGAGPRDALRHQPDNGTAAELPATAGAAGFEIGFNANYLKDILSQIEGDTVELHLADAGADPDPSG